MPCYSTSFIKFSAWAQVILAVFLAIAAIYIYLLNRRATKSDVFESSAALLNHYAGVLTLGDDGPRHDAFLIAG